MAVLCQDLEASFLLFLSFELHHGHPQGRSTPKESFWGSLLLGHGICAIALLSDMSCAGCRAKHPQACEGRLCHQEAHSHPLTSSRSSLSRGQEQGSSHWLWYARGLRTSLCLEFFLSASRSAARLLSGPSPLPPQLRPDVQFTVKLVANGSRLYEDDGVGRIAWCSIIVMQC